MNQSELLWEQKVQRKIICKRIVFSQLTIEDLEKLKPNSKK